MTTQRTTPLGPTLAYLHWRFIAGAVLQVREEIYRSATLTGHKADDPSWFISAEMRQDLWTRVRAVWLAKTKKSFDLFPYSVDYVARLYFRFRGLPERSLVDWEGECEGEQEDD